MRNELVQAYEVLMSRRGGQFSVVKHRLHRILCMNLDNMKIIHDDIVEDAPTVSDLKHFVRRRFHERLSGHLGAVLIREMTSQIKGVLAGMIAREEITILRRQARQVRQQAEPPAKSIPPTLTEPDLDVVEISAGREDRDCILCLEDLEDDRAIVPCRCTPGPQVHLKCLRDLMMRHGKCMHCRDPLA
jgi:hypothetical protein